MESFAAELLFNEARSKDELWKFLGGYPEYALTNIHANLPTDMGGAITPIQQRADADHSLRGEVTSALIRLSEDTEYGWMALYYLQYIQSLCDLSGSDWLENGLVDSIATRIRANKEAYKSLKKWQGERFENGVWELILGANTMLHEKYNITVLPEEL